MSTAQAERCTQRAFLGRLTLAGTAGLLGLRSTWVAAEPPPEIATIRLHKTPSICVAPQYVAEELLHLEGFTEVEYVETGYGAPIHQALGSGALDMTMGFVPAFIIHLDAGAPIMLLAGVHVGCFELFGTVWVHAIRNLKGKTVAVPELGSPHQLFIASMAQYVGLDPQKDIHWAVHPPAEATQLLAEEKIDALVGFPPVVQELRANKIGHVVVTSAVDRPWSQYFCCIVTGNREFVRKYPAATKRALRGILKATDVCALEPDRASQLNRSGAVRPVARIPPRRDLLKTSSVSARRERGAPS
jgi:NitT/TauT family transport system substrate-binding protein